MLAWALQHSGGLFAAGPQGCAAWCHRSAVGYGLGLWAGACGPVLNEGEKAIIWEWSSGRLAVKSQESRSPLVRLG